jgi:hypothetical protein
MKLLATLALAATLLTITGCKTASGAAIGAGTAGIAGGDVATGALIGGGVGAVLDVMD